MYTTPILLITFNRPDHTQRVLEAILASVNIVENYICPNKNKEY